MTHSEEVARLQAKALDDYVGGLLAAQQEQHQRDLNSALNSIAQLEATVATKTTELTHLTTENENLTGTIAQRDASIASLVGQISAANAEIARLKEELANQPNADYVPGFSTPIFYDDFTRADANLNKWNVRHEFVTVDMAKGMRENVKIENGALHLLGTWLPEPVSGGPRGKYTHKTGYIDTRNLKDTYNPMPKHFSVQYGRWEIECFLPTAGNTRGLLSAFWLRCDNHMGEIDWLEAWGGGGPMSPVWTTYTKDTGTTTIHSSTTKSTINGKPYRKMFWRLHEHGAPRPLNAGFHKFAFERTPDYMAIYVDGKQLTRVTPESPDPVNKVGSTVNPSGTLAWMWDPDFFGSPLHMRLNMHIGASADYWGDPDPANREWTKDPMDYAIRSIKVWKHTP